MWILPADVEAQSYDAAEIEFAADWSPRPRRGCLYFARPDAPFSLERRVCFDWLADGSMQRSLCPSHRIPSGSVGSRRCESIPSRKAPQEIEGSLIRLGGVRLIERALVRH